VVNEYSMEETQNYPAPFPGWDLVQQLRANLRYLVSIGT
jgi:hypothetical protein